jgi:hypothetical protein
MNELKRMWKEAVVGYFKALPPACTGETEENHEETSGMITDLRIEI